MINDDTRMCKSSDARNEEGEGRAGAGKGLREGRDATFSVRSPVRSSLNFTHRSTSKDNLYLHRLSFQRLEGFLYRVLYPSQFLEGSELLTRVSIAPVDVQAACDKSIGAIPRGSNDFLFLCEMQTRYLLHSSRGVSIPSAMWWTKNAAISE